MKITADDIFEAIWDMNASGHANASPAYDPDDHSLYVIDGKNCTLDLEELARLLSERGNVTSRRKDVRRFFIFTDDMGDMWFAGSVDSLDAVPVKQECLALDALTGDVYRELDGSWQVWAHGTHEATKPFDGGAP